MQPLFIILTPTHKRPTELARAMQSVRMQTYTNYIHIIINDSPEYDYTDIKEECVRDAQIVYLENEKNVGKNASLNNALAYIFEKKIVGYVLFLDDDDWLHNNALQDLAKTLTETNTDWLVTERVFADTQKNLDGKNEKLKKYNYFWDYLIGRKLTGDKTHSIHTNLLFSQRKSLFSENVKNGEEWFFFCQLSPHFLYTPLPSTLTSGYMIDGLNEGMQKTYSQNTWKLWKEAKNTKIVFYLTLRTVQVIKKLILNRFR